jgi:hypothetical protein
MNEQDGHYEPDGHPFEAPADSFERVYNHRLAVDPEGTKDAVHDPHNGWPISMRAFTTKPATKHLRAVMNQFFEDRYQHAALEAGNSPEELDTLAKRLLAFAAMDGLPVTDRERTLAERLGVDLSGAPREQEAPKGY